MDEGTYGTISVSLKDAWRGTGVVKVKVPTASATLVNAEALADFIVTHSDAAVVGYGVNVDTINDTAASGNAYDRVYQRLVFLFEDSNGAARRFSIPAPVEGDVDDTQEPTAVAAGLVEQLLETFGMTLTGYNGGYLASRAPSGRSTELTAPV